MSEARHIAELIDWGASSYDDLAAMLNDQWADEDEVISLTEQVSADLTLRIHLMEAAARAARPPYRPRLVIGPAVKPFIAACLTYCAFRSAMSVPAISIAAIAGLAVWMTVESRRVRHVPAPPKRSKPCTNCNADLADQPDAIPESVLDYHVGPAACPACGTLWPLLPCGVRRVPGVHAGVNNRETRIGTGL